MGSVPTSGAAQHPLNIGGCWRHERPIPDLGRAIRCCAAAFPEADIENVAAIHHYSGQKPAKTAKLLPGVFVIAKGLIWGCAAHTVKNDRF